MIHSTHTLLSLGLAVLFCLNSNRTASALTTNLVPVADTALRSSVPDNNFGAAPELPLGNSLAGSVKNHCLFKFDVSAIPSNAVITSVTLELVVMMDPTAPGSFDVDRLLRDWSEGSGENAPFAHNGSPANPGEATWNSRFHTVATWDTGGGQAGADFAASPSVSTALVSGTNDFTSAGLAADVQQWLQNPGTNFGWIVVATGDASATGKLIGSREDPLHTPMLIVDYSLPAATAPILFAPALAGNQFRFSFNAEANRTYTVEFRDSLTAGTWNLLTNVNAQPVPSTIHITNLISSPTRYYRARTP